MHVLLPCLEMSSSGNTWEGYQWVDGWPMTPPRPPVQPTTPADLPDELQEEREMLVETSLAAAPIVNTAGEDTTPTINTVTSVQVMVNHMSQGELEETPAGSDHTGTSCATSQLSDSEEEENGSSTIKLGNSYTQVRSAREASMTVEVTDISCNENALITERKKGYRVGSMDKNLNNEILNCFKGVRIEKNGNLVNQYLSCSFDPSTNICITCSTEHNVWGGGWILVFCSL
jgi:hypothetical protein